MAIIGSAGLTPEYGEAACDPTVELSEGPAETYETLNWGAMLATGVDSPCAALLNIEGLAKSEGEAAVVADMGFVRKSSPKPSVSIRRSVGKAWEDCGTGA